MKETLNEKLENKGSKGVYFRSDELVKVVNIQRTRGKSILGTVNSCKGPR